MLSTVIEWWLWCLSICDISSRKLNGWICRRWSYLYVLKTYIVSCSVLIWIYTIDRNVRCSSGINMIYLPWWFTLKQLSLFKEIWSLWWLRWRWSRMCFSKKVEKCNILITRVILVNAQSILEYIFFII
jgi:hypothetical protein